MTEIDLTCAAEPPCVVTPPSLYGGQPESNFQVSVTPDPATASWSASSPVPWVQFPESTFPMTGTQTLIVRIVLNPESFRETTITFGTTPVVVKQEGVATVPPEPEPGPDPNPDSPYAHACQDREPRAKPALPQLGPAGFAFHDPAFGTPMLRVTDETMGGSSFRVPSNAHLAAFNADSTKFIVCGQTGVKAFAYDGTTARAIADVQMASADVKTQGEPCWSRRDPNVLYTLGGQWGRTIQAVTLLGEGNAQTTDLLDLDTLGLDLGFDDATRTYVGGIITSDDSIVVFFGGTGQDKHHYIGQMPIGGTTFTTLVDTQTLGPLACLLHSAAVDLSGQYLALYPTGAQPYQTIFIDVSTQVAAPVTVSPGGHDALGYGWQVNADSGTAAWDAAQWQLRPLDALDNRRDLIDPVLTPKVVYLSEHSTWNNAVIDRSVPVISSTFRFNDESAPWRALDDEVIAIETEGPSTVYRFCHHRSDSRDEENSASTYFWYQPIANVSPCGRFALVTSNWEKTLGADPADPGRSRQDVFLVQLAA